MHIYVGCVLCVCVCVCVYWKGMCIHVGRSLVVRCSSTCGGVLLVVCCSWCWCVARDPEVCCSSCANTPNMRHATHINELHHIWMRRIMQMNSVQQAHEWDTSRNHAHEWVMSRTWMSHVTHMNVSCSAHALVMRKPCRTRMSYERVMPHTCHKHATNMPQTCHKHATHIVWVIPSLGQNGSWCMSSNGCASCACCKSGSVS